MNLDYMHARYFSAHLGRFHSVDPVGAAPGWPQSWNRYSYVLGNPMKYTDPRGLYWWSGFNPYDQLPVGAFDDAIEVTGTNVPLLFSVLGLLSGPKATSGGFPAANARAGPGGSNDNSRSVFQQLFCPRMAQGLSIDFSTINPFTSGGGGSYGLNLQYVPGEGLGIYTLGSPDNSTSVGFDVGLAVTVNGAIGSGPWSGDSLTSMGSYLFGTGGGFGTPSDQVTANSIGWHGIQVGGTFGFPVGWGVTTTSYNKKADLSFLMPWCQ